MSLNLSNGSDFSSNGSSDLRNKKGSNNNMTSSLMSHDSYVHYHVDKIQKKDNMLKVFAFLLVFLLVLLAVFVTLYFHTVVKYTKDANQRLNKTKGACSNKECVKISARIIETMNDKVDPCDNFYQYACGGWLKRTPIPDSRTRYSRFEKLSEKNSVVLKQILNDLIRKKRNASTPVLMDAAHYYETCMNTKQIELVGDEPMKELVEKLGSWPVTNPDFNESTWDAMEALVNVHKNISQAPVFNIYVSGDIKNSNENVIVFDQSGIMMDKESYLQNSSFHIRHRQAYRKMMKAIVLQMGAEESSLHYMDRVFEFETELAKITMSVLMRRDYRVIYKRMTFKEFSDKTNISMDWLSKFVNSIFSETGSKILPTEEIVSFNTEYIRDAYKLFTELPKKVQASYVAWNAVKVMAPVILGKYQDIMDEYFMTAFGTKDRQPRWETCIGSTSGAFGYALARPFVEEVYDKTAKVMSTEMILAIKGVFENNLDNMDWMDEKTKVYAKEKASKILQNIGYPDFILNNTALELEYKGLTMIRGQHFKNYMERRKYKNLKNYMKRGKPVDKSQWGILPTTVNAYYAPTENKIGFPAGILQWPFYDKNAPRAVSYGAIGMVVGHEITHGFDDQGKDFTIAGNFDTWWTNKSTTGFADRSKCFVDQYSKFELFGRNMKGEQTLGENLADNGGIRQSLQAYRNWVAIHGEEKQLPGLDLSPDQLYFLAFAQVWCTAYRESAAINQIENGVHSLSMFRVIGTLQNNEDFSKAYKCPVGSKMNPPKKCRVW